MNEGRYVLKYNMNISIIIHFKQYLPSSIQSAVFIGRVARQTNRLYVQRMIVKLAYKNNIPGIEAVITQTASFQVLAL